MFTRENRGTTGETVTRIAVLNCLAHNALEENHLDAETRQACLDEAKGLARQSEYLTIETPTGNARIRKVHLRSFERCAFAELN